MVEARRAIEEANARIGASIVKRDGAAIAALYSEDATLLPPGSDALRGRGAIEAFWKGGIEAGMKEGKLTTLDVTSLGGDLACEVGRYAMTMQPPGQPAVTDEGKYVVIWKRHGDGGWRLHIDIWNSSRPTR